MINLSTVFYNCLKAFVQAISFTECYMFLLFRIKKHLYRRSAICNIGLLFCHLCYHKWYKRLCRWL